MKIISVYFEINLVNKGCYLLFLEIKIVVVVAFINIFRCTYRESVRLEWMGME